MYKMTSKRDVRNYVDGCFQSTPTTEQFAAAVDLVVQTAHDMGLEYGDDWAQALESLTIEELEAAHP